MLRTIYVFVLATCLAAHAIAQDAGEPSRWSAVTAVSPKSPASKLPDIVRVQEPFCEYGVGLCGGTCNEDGGKRWDCAPTELPCYQLGHCKCEAALVCKPPAPTKKKKGGG